MNTKTFTPFQVRPLPRSIPTDLDECHQCGAPAGEWVLRVEGNPMNWKLCGTRGASSKGYGYASLVKVGDDGLCRACKTLDMLAESQRRK